MPAAKELPSQDELAQLFWYEPETGKLYWRERPASSFPPGKNTQETKAKRWNSLYAGREIATKHPHGYVYCGIDRCNHLAHRIVWKLVYGDDPKFIDHINGVKHDNRIENLRSVTHQENHRNVKRHRNNASGVHGVHWCNKARRWVARITVSGSPRFLGQFQNLDDAVQARRDAEARYGFHENHGRESA